MTDPITPPPELVQQWYMDATGPLYEKEIAIRAAQWGADQELEACCEWLAKYRKPILGADLKFVRRPKPPSLKEQALHAADLLFDHSEIGERALAQATVRRALEALPE